MPQDTEAIDAVAEYFRRLAEIRATGAATAETSYYSALENLVNALGRNLKPRVVCNGQLRNQGAGNPDFGLYTRNQLQAGEPRPGQLPERGVIEVKPLSEETWITAKSQQATKYFGKYRLILITNYRDFRLVGSDAEGNAIDFERLSLATDAATFWQLTSSPTASANTVGHRLIEFLQRVLMTAAPLARAEDVAWFLASYARESFQEIEGRDIEPLEALRQALTTALGVTFDAEEGDHFFRSTLVQTLFYGVFSAWVIHARKSSAKFDWRTSAFHLTVPMVRALFEQIATPSKLGALGIIPFLDRTADVLNRVQRAAFFETFDTGAAIQHFYEPFLDAYDPELRKELGVWYTPKEIVSYMVERVDRVLRTELNIADGLADKNVYVLDPCCGTGAYLVEVLRRIHKTLDQKGGDALTKHDVKKAALERVFGFELLSAPFVVAHWQVGNFLEQIKAPLDANAGERAAVYLTNALTGWDATEGSKASLPLFPELARERDAAEHVKRETPILVVLGNPPYNAFAGTSPDEEHGLVDSYKQGLASKWGITKYNLDDLYVRFFRVAERRIRELGRGIVSFISNYSFVSEASFVVMRQQLLDTFDSIWIENMHGDRKRSEYAPDGQTSETVFAMRGFSPGIRQGIVVSLGVRKGASTSHAVVRFRDDINAASAHERRQQLLSTLDDPNADSHYELANPEPFNRYSLRPRDVAQEYKDWPSLENLSAFPPINGLMEKRGGALMDASKTVLAARMKAYLDSNVSWEAYSLSSDYLTKNAAGFDARKTRSKLHGNEPYDDDRLRRYFVRPFDFQYCYYSSVQPLWNRARPDLWRWVRIKDNRFLVSREAAGGNPEGFPMYDVGILGDDHALRTDAYFFPRFGTPDQGPLIAGNLIPNLSSAAALYLEDIWQQDQDSATLRNRVDALWLHALAIGYSPGYVTEHRDGLAVGWPRVPLPASLTTLRHSASLGQRISDLLNADTAVSSVTAGTINPILRVVGLVTSDNLEVTAGWGRQDGLGRVNPGIGRIQERTYTAAEIEAIEAGATELGQEPQRVLELLGPPLDVYMNETSSWSCIPLNVWRTYIGGYQVLKKWLSYRESAIIERALTVDEAREVTAVARRLAMIVLSADELDTNYKACVAQMVSWPDYVSSANASS